MKYYRCPKTHWVGYLYNECLYCLYTDENMYYNQQIHPYGLEEWLSDGTLIEISEQEMQKIKLERL